MGEQLGVSATPAREAIERLQAERALVIGSNPVPTVPLPSRKDPDHLSGCSIGIEDGHYRNFMDALKRGDSVAARTAIEADIGGAASDLEEFLPE